MECLSCGVENVGDAKFCKGCGQSLPRLVPSDEVTIVTDSRGILHRFIVNERFKILKKLGKGGMGEVLLAEDVKLKRKVAVKSILKSSLADPTAKARFLREAQTASQLDHPNICTIYEIYEESDKEYIVMQYIDGVPLDHIIGPKPLGIDKILDISIQVCSGMIEAHSRDIIHRDIKSANIMVDKKGVVKILDFGLAKFSGESAVKTNGMVDSDLTEKGFVLGTVAYISPEQAKGKTLDRATDVFSFGVALYEMIEGKNPFKEEEQIETLYNILNKEVQFTRDIPGELEEIVRKTLEKDCKNRYPDFSRLKEDLEAFQVLYAQLKEKNRGGDTEIINVEEQGKLLEEIRKSSDKENLGDLVYRIKKSRDSTERVLSTKKRNLKFLWAPAILILVLITGFLLFRNAGTLLVDEDEKFYIYLHPFENKTEERALPEMIDHLLMESLNQFDEFKTINEEAALPIAGGEGKTVDLQLLKEKFNVKFELTGEISKDTNFYKMDAHLRAIEEGGKPRRITAPPGPDRDAILNDQLDFLSERVYLKFFPRKEKELEIKKISQIFGTNWIKYSNFYAGLRYFERLETDKAEFHFTKSRDLLITKYYLSKLYHFRGKRRNALKLIDEILLDRDKLTGSLQLKVGAIKARLNFKFKDEVKNLEKLKNMFKFKKEVFFELGEAYFHQASPEKAVAYYEKAIELDSRYSEALNHLGYCHSYMGNHTRAIELFEDYRDFDDSANSFDSLGDGYFYYGKLKIAERMKKTAVSPGKDKISWPYQTLADIYILKAKYKEAEEALDKYLRLEGDKRAEAYTLAKLAFIQYVEKQYDVALQLIDRSLEAFDSADIKDNTAEAHWLKGLILSALNNVEESKRQLQWLEEFKKKYRLDRENFHAAFKYLIHLEASIRQKENKAERAEELFKGLIDMKNKLSYWITYYNYPFFHTEYAKYLSGNQRYEEALGEVNKCLEFNGNYIPALWLKGETLEKLKREDEAKIVYEKIAELYGQSPGKNDLRNKLKAKLNF